MAGYTAAQQHHTPERSLVQRMEALQRANEVRTRRAELKRELGAGRVTRGELALMLLEPPEWLETGKAFDVLLALPKWGRVKVNKALVQTRIAASKTIGGMSVRQRLELIDRLGLTFEERAKVNERKAELYGEVGSRAAA